MKKCDYVSVVWEDCLGVPVLCYVVFVKTRVTTDAACLALWLFACKQYPVAVMKQYCSA